MGSDLVERLRTAKVYTRLIHEDVAHFVASDIGAEAAARIAELEAALSAATAERDEARQKRDDAESLRDLFKAQFEELQEQKGWSKSKRRIWLNFTKHIIAKEKAKREAAEAEAARLREQVELLRPALQKTERALTSANVILGNMAQENDGFLAIFFNRWPISHEPLRHDAKCHLRMMAEALDEARVALGGGHG